MKNEFGLNVIVALNKFSTDTDNEIEFVKKELSHNVIPMTIVEGWAKGGDGAIDIAEKIVQISEKETNFKFIYEDSESIKEKIEHVAKKIYGADGVNYTELANKNIEKIEKLGKSNLPVCIAKTQYSLSDDAKNLECKEPFSITVRDVGLKNGAEFIVVYCGKIMTMPGLPKVPAAEKIDVDENGEIVGIF